MANFYLQLYTTILLMFSISMVSSATTANNVDSLVLDVEGNPLEVGSFYYVRTPQSTFRWGGGIVAASKPNQPECPQYVAQLGEGWYRESPIKFLPSDPSHKHVHISSDVNVVFNNSFSACSQGAWQLTPDANSGDLFLSTGGGIGNPSPQTAANWFKIEKRRGDPGFYQLEYCPSNNTIDAFATKKDIVCGAIDGSIDNLTDDHRMIWLSLFPIRPDDYFSTGLMFLHNYPTIGLLIILHNQSALNNHLFTKHISTLSNKISKLPFSPTSVKIG